MSGLKGKDVKNAASQQFGWGSVTLPRRYHIAVRPCVGTDSLKAISRDRV